MYWVREILLGLMKRTRVVVEKPRQQLEDAEEFEQEEELEVEEKEVPH
jgi:hypothetical protein